MGYIYIYIYIYILEHLFNPLQLEKVISEDGPKGQKVQKY
jgi:hypothetical protein